MIIVNGYIVAIEKSDSNFGDIIMKIQSKPTDPEGYQYKLRADSLEWEQVELLPVEEPDLTADEALDIILGVSE